MNNENDVAGPSRPVVDAIAGLQGIVAISLGDSTQAGHADQWSDFDLHVYWRAPLAVPAERAQRLERIADKGSITVDIRSWGLEDALRVDGRLVELIYVELDDLQARVEQVYSVGLNSEGFTTAFLYSVAGGRLLYDPAHTLEAIQRRLNDEFPAATRQALLLHQPPRLHIYLKHLRLGQRRGDLLVVQHRRYTLQMVFFNILFTLNRRYHPGEKRLLIHSQGCPIRPPECEARWTRVACLGADDPALFTELEALVEDLGRLVEAHG